MNSVFLCGDEWLVQRVIVCSVNHSWQFLLHELLHILMLCITMVLINHLLDRVGGLHFSGFYFVFEKLNILAWLYLLHSTKPGCGREEEGKVGSHVKVVAA